MSLFIKNYFDEQIEVDSEEENLKIAIETKYGIPSQIQNILKVNDLPVLVLKNKEDNLVNYFIIDNSNKIKSERSNSFQKNFSSLGKKKKIFNFDNFISEIDENEACNIISNVEDYIKQFIHSKTE